MSNFLDDTWLGSPFGDDEDMDNDLDDTWLDYPYLPPDPETLTCFGCGMRDKCEYVDDDYNTNGDCLAMK